MDYIIHIFLMSLWSLQYAAAAYDPLAMMVPQMVRSRRGVNPIYNNEFMDEYEPYALAAIPLPSHMPLFHIIPPPQAYPSKYKARKPVRERPQPEREYVYTTSEEQNYEPYSQEYTETSSKPKYATLYEEDTSPVYVYARPNKNGGFSYRKPSVPTYQAFQGREPFVVRIQKYRVNREK